MPYLHLPLNRINPNFGKSDAMSVRSKDPDILPKGNVVFQGANFPTQYMVKSCISFDRHHMKESKTISVTEHAQSSL